MSRFSTRIKSLHILGNFSKLMVVEFEDASTSFCGRKTHLFGSVSSPTTGPPLQIKKVGWIQQQFVTLARLADRGLPGHCLGTRSQTESECWKTETENWNWNSCVGRSRNLKVCPSAWLFTSTWFARVVRSLELLSGELSRGYTRTEARECSGYFESVAMVAVLRSPKIVGTVPQFWQSKANVKLHNNADSPLDLYLHSRHTWWSNCSTTRLPYHGNTLTAICGFLGACTDFLVCWARLKSAFLNEQTWYSEVIIRDKFKIKSSWARISSRSYSFTPWVVTRTLLQA